MFEIIWNCSCASIFLRTILLAILSVCPNIVAGSVNHFVIGGLFPIHAQAESEEDKCGVLLNGKGIQRLEAFFFALDSIKDDEMFSNFSFNATVFDTCSNDAYAMEQSLGFLTGSKCSGNPESGEKVIAVVGAANSPVSIAVANVLRLFQIPQVSYASTSHELDDVQKYPYFFRVVPSDKFQITAILDLIKKMKWSYFSAVTAFGEYGEHAITQLETRLRHPNFADICLAATERLPRFPTENDYEDVIWNLLRYRQARAVIVFLDEVKLRNLLFSSVKVRAPLNIPRSHFLWIGSDSWGTKIQPIEKLESFAEGAITILPKRYEIPGFNEYFQSLRPIALNRNPWFNEYWEKKFNCSFDPRKIGTRRYYTQLCSGRERSTTTFQQEGLVPMVVDSVYVIVHALRNLCNNHQDICSHWDSLHHGQLLKQHIANVTVESRQGRGRIVKFDKDRNVYTNYTFYQFRKVNDTGEMYEYVPIGEWNPLDGISNWSGPKWDWINENDPKSVCSRPCLPGYERIRYRNKSCCWNCSPCNKNDYFSTDGECVPCPGGYVPNKNHTGCEWLAPIYMGSDLSMKWALMPILFSCFGIVGTSVVAGIFVMYRNTPAIKAAGRELCYIIFAGILQCYCFTFIAVAKPADVTCGILRISLGLGLSVCYASIFTKTNRISRIFNRRLSTTKRPAYISPRSQVVIVLCLVAIQLTFTVMWLIVNPPKATIDVSIPLTRLLTCGIDSQSVLLGLIYNIILVLLCTVYAFKTRNIPENFNEAKFISFTMYASCIVWLAFIAIYSSGEANFKVQSTVLCMTVSMSGTIVLVCIFFPKIYIVLFQPQKNVKYPTSTTPSTNIATNMTAVKYLRSGVNTINVLLPPSTSSSHNSFTLSPSPDSQEHRLQPGSKS